MTIENIGLFQAMSSKMNYLAERQKVISQNIANADTPGYVSQDLAKVDFGRMVEKVSKKTKGIRMDVSNESHLLPQNEGIATKQTKNKKPFEIAPDGNAVILEEQMIKASQVQLDYGMMLNLYRNNVDMIRTSLGKNK